MIANIPFALSRRAAAEMIAKSKIQVKCLRFFPETHRAEIAKTSKKVRNWSFQSLPDWMRIGGNRGVKAINDAESSFNLPDKYPEAEMMVRPKEKINISAKNKEEILPVVSIPSFQNRAMSGGCQSLKGI